MSLLFACRKCGAQAPTLEGHRCVAAPEPRRTVDLDIPATASERVARLERARAALAATSVHGQAVVEDGRAVLARLDLPSPTVLAAIMRRPRSASSAIDPEKGFDRAAYQKAYMRGWRARRKAKPTS